eukprot:g11955.t1
MSQRRRSSRRGLACLVVALATGAFTVYKTVGGGGASAPLASDGSPSVDAGGGAVRGNRFKGTSAAEAAAAAAATATAREDARAVGAGNIPAEHVENLAMKVGNKGREQELEPGPDGRFRLKVGQIEVVASESLDFSTEDSVPGLMWLPIGLRDVTTGDPWVTMCLMNYKHYQESPSSTPMFAHLNNFSKCGFRRKDDSVSAGMVAVVRMSSLQKSIEEQGRAPIPPKGFVYHETRCGSTLVANMLAALPPSRVFSESKPPTQAIRECAAEGCDSQTTTKLFRDVVGLMGRRRNDEQHEHLYFKFQNSKFLPQISEAYPEVPWVFVFRDPVEVMVSNLKSFAGAPCVRIPRQEKARKAAKGAGPKGGARGAKGKNVEGAGRGGGAGRLGASGPGMKALQAQRQEKKQKAALGGPGGDRDGGGETRRLSATGGGGDGDIHAEGDGADGEWTVDADSGAVALWEEDGEEGEEEEDGGGDCDLFGSVSWNSYTSDGVDSLGAPLPEAAFPSCRPLALESEVADQQARRLQKRRPSQELTMDMTMECADWLKAMCVSAIVAEKKSPSNALFVDYSNLPDAIPEFVFPHHFGMAEEVSKTVPEWKDIMHKAAGTYSKGIGKVKTREFTNDVEAKHKNASPLIVEASEVDGGLYDLYHSLDALQSWRRPESGE